MPAIITHDLFAKDLYGDLFETIGGSRDEAEAFLLGNQGPDPLFFAVPDVRYRRWAGLGSTLHRMRPAEFLVALKSSVRELPAAERSVGRAWALGYVGHYELDRAVHPLIRAQVRDLTRAGVKGLDASHESEVHAVIETELDELALTAKRGETVASFNPGTAVLKGRDSMLDTVSRLHALAVREALGTEVPDGLYKSAVRADRLAQRAVHSPRGTKRRILGAAERLVRDHSMAAAVSHRAAERRTSAFANEGHGLWQHPTLEATSTASFWDLYREALGRARASIAAMDDDAFNLDAALRIAGAANFYGDATCAVVVSVETLGNGE